MFLNNIDKQGESDTEMMAPVVEAGAEFLQLKNIGNSEELSAKTKIRIFNTNDQIVLLNGSETWGTSMI